MVHAFLDGAEATAWKGLGIVPTDFPDTHVGLVESLVHHK
ncbi:hypothetical protein HDA41_000117 [Streptomyces caelestis]|jgi:1-phosphatidylinositol phosphodiesterase|uniref:Uncharacterized protein n=1 Tax=Streptomyces caelestis TaxID=36816 RepID=A0A7W9GY05_9ACTN|nr:hypothetical protein [Streptomyces caelestis]